MSLATEVVEVGQVVATGTYPLDRDALVRYAAASGDHNPIHYRDDIATAVGLPGVIAHGMLTMGVAVQPVVSWLGGRGAILEYGVRFTRPVPVPPEGVATVDVTAAVGQLGDDGTARIDLTVRLEAATVLARAQVRVRLP